MVCNRDFEASKATQHKTPTNKAHCGSNMPALKRRAVESELAAVHKRAKFEKRPVPEVVIPLLLLLGWQTKVLARLGATLAAPRRTILWVWSTTGNAGKSSFIEHLKVAL